MANPLGEAESDARRIMAQTLGVVHVFVSGKPTKYRLAEQPRQCVPTIFAGACVGERLACHYAQQAGQPPPAPA